MISHKYKFIFIHIPKCAGSSLRDFYFDTPKLDWRLPNYKLLYGWCPKRKIHLQHATSKQLLELDLIKPKDWNEYFKFTFVRNPYDRAYSDYLWLQKDRAIKGRFRDFITKSGVFENVLNDKSVKEYRGDHLIKQTDFFDFSGFYKLDFIGEFERLDLDIEKINKFLGITSEFNYHTKKNISRKKHYSLFYTDTNKRLFEKYYNKDIKLLNYKFEDKRTGISEYKKWI